MALDEDLLEEKLAELETCRVWTPRVVSKLEHLIRDGDDWALFRINPFYLASERGMSEDEAVDLLLHATKVGLFQMTWNLLCPGCGAAVQSFSTLKNVVSLFRCFLCSTDVETRLDDFVHVGFTVSPKIRAIAAHDPGALPVEDLFYRYYFTREARTEPGGPRFVEILPQLVLGMSHVLPDATTVFDLTVGAGELVAYDMVTNAVFVFHVTAGAGAGNPPQRLRLQDGRVGLAPGSLGEGAVRLEIENDGELKSSVIVMFKPQEMLDQMQAQAASSGPLAMTFDRFLSGRRLLTCHTFRQTFSTEIIRTSDGIGVRDVSILFTDLKGSTAMYDRIGDLKAFALVNQHFERLNRAITRNHGAVIKTIGDAVMASFESPVDSVRAARDMLNEIEAFNEEVGEKEIVLKVGIHRGASIAVTLNERLDFFGQTVNVAARVQGLADADEIYITEEVYRAPEVADVLSGLHVTPESARLKGVQRTVGVYRVALHAPSSRAG
jgi:class 3 adenylate cyclase